MKTIFRIIAIICVILVFGTVAVGGYGYLKYQTEGDTIEKETSGLVVESIKAISNSWNTDEMVKRAHPKLIAEMQKSGQNWDSLFNVYRKLGQLKSDITCKLINHQDFHGLPESYAFADYECSGKYENGDATIAIELAKDSESNGVFLITAFQINSPLFTKILENK